MAVDWPPLHRTSMVFPQMPKRLCVFLIAFFLLNLATASDSTVGRVTPESPEQAAGEPSWREWYQGATNRAWAIWEAATGPVPSGSGTLGRETAVQKIDALDRSTNQPSPRRPPGKQMGQRLLRDGDPSGAEVACSAATRRDPYDVESWTCLGEARLALHEAAHRAGGAQGGIAAAKLAMAKENFEEAMSIDPTHPRARAGLGLSLLLMGTRNEGVELSQVLSDASLHDMSDSLDAAMSASSAQLLFDSILHLKAAALMTAPNVDEEGGAWQLHIAATHNAALAHLVLGDASSAVSLLRRVADLAARRHKGGITAEVVNLGGALLQLGLAEEAAAALSTVANEYCQSDDINHQGGADGDSSRDKKALCSTVHNNLGVAQELLLSTAATLDGESTAKDDAYQSAFSHYSLSVRWDGNSAVNAMNAAALSDEIANLDDKDGQGTAISERDGDSTDIAKDETRDNLDRDNTAIATEKDSESVKEDASNTNEDKADIVTDTTEELEPTVQDSKQAAGDIPPELIAALNVLEATALQDPGRSRLWLSLSRARAHAGDKAGSVEAAAKAVSVADGKEELDIATAAFEDVLSKLVQKDNVSSDSSNSQISTVAAETAVGTSSDVNTLRLEQEILTLKLQLLQQKVMAGMAQMEEGYPWVVHRQMQEGPRNEPSAKTMAPVRATYEKGSSDDEEEGDLSVTPEKAGDDASLNNESDRDDIPLPPQKSSYVEDSDNVDLVVHNGPPDVDDAVVTKYEEGEGDLSRAESEIADEDEVVMTELLHSLDSQIDPEAEMESEERVETNETKESDDLILASEEDNSKGNASGIDSTDENLVGNAHNEPDREVEKESKKEKLLLPELFDPPPIPPADLPAIASSYMKMADAYMQKENYQSASKQFMKVIKKAPDHIPAILGYATALERAGRPKQIVEVALAYGNATKAALVQGEQGLAEAALRRAVDLARKAQVNKVETLRSLSELAHTADLAADIYYVLGSEAIGEESLKEDAMNAFAIANAFSCSGADSNETAEISDCHGHGKSLLQLGKLALIFHEDASEALRYCKLALESDIGDDKVEALLYSGKAKKVLGDIEAAILDYRSALDLPVTESTAEAHHYLAVALLDHGDDQKAIQSHFEQALNMGMELTTEAIDALGEHNIAVMRSSNRARWLEFEQASASAERGGIMSGSDSVVSSKSVFAPRREAGGTATAQSQLDLLEQGAAAYDGRVPLGGEDGNEDAQSSIVTGQGAASARARA